MSDFSTEDQRGNSFLHLVRHAEAAYNVEHDISLPDPLLTANGNAEAEKFLDCYRFLKRPSLIFGPSFTTVHRSRALAFDPATNPRERSLFRSPATYCVHPISPRDHRESLRYRVVAITIQSGIR